MNLKYPPLKVVLILPVLWRLLWLTFFCGNGFFSLADAAPLIIYDSGNARPITELNNSPKPSPPRPPFTGEDSGRVFVHGLFPIHTPALTPGPVNSRPVQLTLPQPLFLLGTDPLSQHWLSHNQEHLRKMGAVGLVVEAPSLNDYQALKAIAGDLPLAPAPVPDLARQLTLSHYPVLISATRIEQ